MLLPCELCVSICCRYSLRVTPPSPCIKLFAAVLDEVASRYEHSLGSSSIFQFLKSVLAHPLPEPGQTFVVRAFTKDGQRKELQFTRPDDSDYQLGRVSDYCLFVCLFVCCLFGAFSRRCANLSSLILSRFF